MRFRNYAIQARRDAKCGYGKHGIGQACSANVNGVPELIEHEISGYIFKPYNIDAISNAMNYVMKNKDSSIIKNWGLKAQDHVKKNFTIEIMLDNLESYFYEKINNSIRK